MDKILDVEFKDCLMLFYKKLVTLPSIMILDRDFPVFTVKKSIFHLNGI